MFKNRNLCFLFPLIWLSFFEISYGQGKNDPKDWFIEAESFFLFEEYKDALPLYQKILRAEPENYNVLSKIGVCYLNDIYQNKKSIPYLEKAADHISFQYRDNSYREKMAPPETQYYLGRAYHINNMFNKAIESYQRFINLAPSDDYDLDLVKADVEACQLAKELTREPVYFSPKNLGNVINSRSEDVNPVLSGDGKVLVFTRKLPFYSGVFVSVKNENGVWSPPVNLTSEFGLDGDSYTTGISYFGDEIFVYRSDNFDGNIYSSKRINNKWSQLQKLNYNINTKYWESHASISPDGQYLIFTSNRDGGYGGLDIYKSKRNANGEWGKAVNLGPVINSPNNEDTPFLSNEGHTLFFSSQGHKTMGGYDIFVSKQQSDGTWSIPYNMGHPVNTTNDDLFYCPIGNDAFGLYSYYNEDNSEGMLDIYEVKVYNERIPRSFKISGSINLDELDDNSRSKIRVKLVNAATNEIVDETKIDADGSFELIGNQGDYVLVIEGSGIEPYQKKISLDLNQESGLISFNDINLVTTEKDFKPIVAKETKLRQVVEVKNDYFAVTDSLSIPIELIVPKGSDLFVQVFLNDSLISEEVISDVKRRFTYFYRPKPGENLIKFTATDPDGIVSETSVLVTYSSPKVSTPETPEISNLDPESKFMKDFLLEIASEPLQDYINQLDLGSFADFNTLYEHLISEAPNNGFTIEDVQKMFCIFFTQRDLALFASEFSKHYPIVDTVSAQIQDSVNMPFEYINSLQEAELISESDLRNVLFELSADPEQTNSQVYLDLSSFSGSLMSSEDIDLINSRDQAWVLFSNEYGEEKAEKMLKLAASTDNLDYFFQNLLVSSEGGLHEQLASLDFESNQIYNSIALVGFLFKNISDETYSASELLKALELARTNKSANLERFHSLLTNEAEGMLKSQLLLAADQLEENSSYEDLLNYLLSQSKHKKYTRENVYNLLLKLIGIEDVDEFAEKLISYGYSEINNAIADTTLSSFSNPFELVQYLIAITQNYDFTTSDINNLLIRMILERGLYEKGGGLYDDELQQRFWKSRRFIATVILVNIVLLILIILFAIRRRKSDQIEEKSNDG